MNGLTTVTTKGQVTIPLDVRKMLNIAIGDKVSFTTIDPGNMKVVIKIISSHVVDELAGSLSSKIKNSDYKNVRKISGKLLARKYKTT